MSSTYEYDLALTGLRFVDSFFPSGGYAFSSGLEAAVQGGAVRNAEELSHYVVELLTTGIGEREAVAAGLAHDAGVFRHLENCLQGGSRTGGDEAGP